MINLHVNLYKFTCKCKVYSSTKHVRLWSSVAVTVEKTDVRWVSTLLETSQAGQPARCPHSIAIARHAGRAKIPLMWRNGGYESVCGLARDSSDGMEPFQFYHTPGLAAQTLRRGRSPKQSRAAIMWLPSCSCRLALLATSLTGAGRSCWLIVIIVMSGASSIAAGRVGASRGRLSGGVWAGRGGNNI